MKPKISRKSLAYLMLIALGLFIMSLLGGCSSSPLEKSPESPPEPVVTQEIQTDIEKQVDNLLMQEDLYLKQLENSTAADLQEYLDLNFTEADQEIEAIKEELGSMKGLFTLTSKLAWDEIYDENVTETYIDEIIAEHLEGKMNRVDAYLDRSLTSFQSELNQRQIQFVNSVQTNVSAKLAQEGLLREYKIVQDYEYEKLMTKFQDNLMKRGKTDLQMIVGTATLAITIRALCTEASLLVMRRALGSIARQIGYNTSAALATSMADGPLPFGEIVAVVLEIGTGIWVAYEIWDMQYNVKEEIDNKLRSSLMEYKTSLKQKGRETIRKLIEFKRQENAEVKTMIMEKVQNA